MTSISETGHDKNVAGTEKLIVECKALGMDYNPSNPALGIPMLEQMFGKATQSLTPLKTVKPVYDQATFWDGSRAFWDGSRAFWDGSRAFWNGSRAFWDASRAFWDASRAFWDGSQAFWKGVFHKVCKSKKLF